MDGGSMIPMMTADQYERFRQLRSEMDRAGLDPGHVFVPVRPAPASRHSLQVLFIGQATRDWREERVSGYESCARRAAEIVAEFGSKRTGPFWQVVNSIVRGVLVRVGADFPQTGLTTSWDGRTWRRSDRQVKILLRKRSIFSVSSASSNYDMKSKPCDLLEWFSSPETSARRF
jgi:hypothetical protein